MTNKCFYCFKEIPEDIRICSSCESFISMLKDEGIREIRVPGIRVPEFELDLRFILSRGRSCEHCGNIFNREILELLKLKKKTQITVEQANSCVKLFCPECRSFLKIMRDYYNEMIYKRTISYQRDRERKREALMCVEKESFFEELFEHSSLFI